MACFRTGLAAVVACVSLGVPPAFAATQSTSLGINFVTIGAPGNRAARPDERYWNINTPQTEQIGAVAYEYRLSRTEIDATQWISFVNAFTPHWEAMGGSRFDSSFSSESISPTSYDPRQAPGWRINPGSEHKAVTMTWRVAAYYCNWLHNGAATADPNAAWGTPQSIVPITNFTSGAYDTSTFGRRPDGSYTDQITRSAGARFWIPSLDEWTKAVYYDPNRYGAGREGYWLRPGGQNDPLVSGLPSAGGQTSAGGNFPPGFDARTIPVGSYPNIEGPWGVLDASGGVSEWTEGTYTAGAGAPLRWYNRLARGSVAGTNDYIGDDLIDSFNGGGSPILSGPGLRLAATVPTPAAYLGMVLGLSLTIRRSRSCCVDS